MATFKHISSKNADYGAAEQYLTFEHDEFTMKPTLDGNGRLIPRDDYRISSLNCGGEDFAIACMRSNLKYGKNQKREDVKSHHYIISFDPRDAQDNCILLDSGEPCVCVQSISYSLLCRWFIAAALLHQADRKLCTECGGYFLPKSNRGKYCPDCSARVRRRKEAERQRKRYHLSTHLGYERSP